MLLNVLLLCYRYDCSDSVKYSLASSKWALGNLISRTDRWWMFSTITVNYEKWYGNNQATKYFS